MENRVSKIIIIILTILVIGLSSFILYDKVLNKEKSKEAETNQEETDAPNNNEQENNHIELDEQTKKDISEVFKFVYNYYNWSNAYCGSYDYNDTIQIDRGNYVQTYEKSTKYTSYDEMISHLQQYMTKAVIYGRYYMEEDDSYIEKDGKLYCGNFQKGHFDIEIKNINIKYLKSYETIMHTTLMIETEYYGFGETEYQGFETYDVTFKKKDERWIISSYTKKD